jgi:DNA-binding transcriptional ArsR family regulator
MALPSFVKHISVLERSRLIVSRKAGRVRTCSLAHNTVADAEEWFGELRAQWSSRYEKLDGLLATLNGGRDEA